MTHPLALALAMGFALAAPAAAKVVVADFDELGNLDEVYCGKVENVNYCDVNKYDYDHYGPYLFISDYDWRDETSITADPGTFFTPIGFEFYGHSQVWRRACPECADKTAPYELSSYLWDLVNSSQDEFELYDYDFLVVEGYRKGRLVASTALGSEDVGTVNLDKRFSRIDRLRFDLQAGYFEDIGYEEDGYVYTCMLNQHYWCNEAVIDNLVVRTNFAPTVPAPVPLPAALPLLLAGLGGLVLLRRRA